jgi:hypothetical protein
MTAKKTTVTKTATVVTDEAATTKSAVDTAEQIIDGAAANPVIVGAITSAASGLSPKARKGFYYTGIVLGVLVAAAATVAAAVTGNAADVAGSIGGLALSVNSLLAAAHLNTAPTN